MCITNMMNKIDDIWGQTAAMSILVYVLDNGDSILSDFIYGLRKNPQTVARAISKLMEANLIIEKRGEYSSRVFSITPKGKKIAELAKKQKEILEAE